eukprot:1160616-Pelagomonas_calceolata.AAC.4
MQNALIINVQSEIQFSTRSPVAMCAHKDPLSSLHSRGYGVVPVIVIEGTMSSRRTLVPSRSSHPLSTQDNKNHLKTQEICQTIKKLQPRQTEQHGMLCSGSPEGKGALYAVLKAFCCWQLCWAGKV